MIPTYCSWWRSGVEGPGMKPAPSRNCHRSPAMKHFRPRPQTGPLLGLSPPEKSRQIPSCSWRGPLTAREIGFTQRRITIQQLYLISSRLVFALLAPPVSLPLTVATADPSAYRTPNPPWRLTVKQRQIDSLLPPNIRRIVVKPHPILELHSATPHLTLSTECVGGKNLS